MTSQRSEPGRRPAGAGAEPAGRAGRGGTALSALTYAMLALFGAGQALVGAFVYAIGPSPLMATYLDAVIFITCLFGGWGMRTPLGGVAPAAGWFAAAFLLASGTSGGSVVITATAAGEWFLFGGALAAAAGLVAGFALWSRPRGRL